jgi:hypothetical protein
MQAIFQCLTGCVWLVKTGSTMQMYVHDDDAVTALCYYVPIVCYDFLWDWECRCDYTRMMGLTGDWGCDCGRWVTIVMWVCMCMFGFQ